MIKLKLESDFRDWYDWAFDSKGDVVFRRVTTDGMSRREMLCFLEKAGFNPPRHGFFESMVECDKIVLYTDERSHRGDGKKIVSVKEILKEGKFGDYEEYYCSEYIEGPPVSTRLLQIGWMGWMLEYKSDDEWRSNCGNVEIKILGPNHGLKRWMDYPLWAVDFVKDKDGKLHAVDFNIAPGVGGTGLEDEVKGAEVVGLIRGHIEDQIRKKTKLG